MIETLKLMLRLVRVREESRLSALQRARGELDRVQGVVGQLDGYAQEYRAQMVRQGVAGSTPADLMATLEFERKLGQTAHSQKLVVGQLQANVAHVTTQAIDARMRARGVQKLLDKRQAEIREQRAKTEAREIEESIAARMVIDGMNDA